jgi:hypothetical protein
MVWKCYWEEVSSASLDWGEPNFISMGNIVIAATNKVKWPKTIISFCKLGYA